MPRYPYRDARPRVHPSAFVAPGARIVGDVEVGPGSSIWFNAVIRGDADAVRIGADTNVQDNAVLHTDAGSPCLVGDRCTIGHGAIVHGCRIGDGSLVGMGAVVLSGAEIGAGSLVAAGALVAEGKEFPPASLIVGVPARRIREITEEDRGRLIEPGVRHYLGYAEAYRDAGVDPGDG